MRSNGIRAMQAGSSPRHGAAGDPPTRCFVRPETPGRAPVVDREFWRGVTVGAALVVVGSAGFVAVLCLLVMFEGLR